MKNEFIKCNRLELVEVTTFEVLFQLQGNFIINGNNKLCVNYF